MEVAATGPALRTSANGAGWSGSPPPLLHLDNAAANAVRALIRWQLRAISSSFRPQSTESIWLGLDALRRLLKLPVSRADVLMSFSTLPVVCRDESELGVEGLDQAVVQAGGQAGVDLGAVFVDLAGDCVCAAAGRT